MVATDENSIKTSNLLRFEKIKYFIQNKMYFLKKEGIIKSEIFLHYELKPFVKMSNG